MSENQKLQNRVMGDYSIAKSFKGILRIAHILELVKTEQDFYKNPTYYGRPGKLMNISGGSYESNEIGYPNPSKGMDGTITRYSSTNELIGDDDLRVNRVPMTDSMGNYLNWNIGFTGVTIGSDDDINSTSIEIEKFKQTDITSSAISKKSSNFIWQEKYFPVLEAGNIIIGLENKEYPSDKYRIKKDTGLIIESKKNLGKLVVQNRYDKSNPVEFKSLTKKFIQYDREKDVDYRTIYIDDKALVEDYDVFMYRQDDYDVNNYNYELSSVGTNDKQYRGNKLVLDKFNEKTINGVTTYIPKNKQIDCNVGIVNLKNYVSKIINQYLNSSIVEVPTGTIINQFCSLEKWYAAPETETLDDLSLSISENSSQSTSSYAGHRPAMMCKRDVGMNVNSSDNSYNSWKNPFPESTILGACKKINKLINPNYTAEKEDEESDLHKDLGYSPEGYHKEIIPLYKRDYVLCDGSIYALWVFPKNFVTNNYPNRRETLDRFLDLFFSIGYEYTNSPNYINKRFIFEWFDKSQNSIPAYKIVRELAKPSDDKSKGEHLVTSNNCQFYRDEDGNPDKGYPKCGEVPYYLDTDRHALFVEDFLTILAFETIYDYYSKAGNIDIKWDNVNINELIAKTEIPEKYRLNTFVGDSVEDLKGFINRTNFQIDDNFIMELPYYNFMNDGDDAKLYDTIPLIRLGREVKTFGDPIKFWDESEKKWAIVEAYKIPQIQYFIDLFTNYPTVDTLAPCLNTYFQYNFQVPNLCGNLPTFIGSTGVSWCDNKFRKLREIESWSADYAQLNYQHRHFIFLEPSRNDPSEGDGEYNTDNNQPREDTNRPTADSIPDYNSGRSITSSTYVASANWWGGSLVIGTGEDTNDRGRSYAIGAGGHINYIWNELGAGDAKISNITLVEEPIISNGMKFNIFQNVSTDEVSWTTGDYRRQRNSSDDILMEREYDADMVKTYYDNQTTVEFPPKTISEKQKYESDTGWYGWEHYEDPRFESAEPNRGRTSGPKHVSFIEDSISFKRYNVNKENFNITKNKNIVDAEWFSPENIKMLPLIKL